MKLPAVFLCVGVLCAVGAGGPAAATAPHVVVYGSLTTVRSDQPLPPGAAAGATLTAARNEAESFQVAVEAGSGGVGGVSVDLGAPLVGPHGATIPASAWTIYREASYVVTTASDDEGATGAWPDALIPTKDYFYGERRNAFPVQLVAGAKATAWIDVLVPRSQAAGVYRGSLLVRGGGSTLATLPVQLTVLNFALPATSSLRNAFATSWSSICEAHTGSATCNGDTARQWTLAALYARAGLENRVTLSNPAPAADNAAPDAADFNRYLRPLVDGTAPIRLQGARLTTLHAASFCVTQSTTCLGDWRELALRDGFADRFVLYACDEPDEDATIWDACKQAAAAARSRWPGVSVLITAAIQDAQAHDAVSTPDVISPRVQWMDNQPCSCGERFAGNQRDAYDAFLSHDTPGTAPNGLWLYTDCYAWGCGVPEGHEGYWRGWPGYAIDEPASEQRALGWLSFEYDTSGELYWQTAKKLTTAWTDQYFMGGNGDGTLFYPGTPSLIGGTHGIPIESIRLKRIRDGREDYEYLRWLADHGQSAVALGVTAGLFGPRDRAMYSANVPESALLGARTQLATAITAVVGTGVDLDPPRNPALASLSHRVAVWSPSRAVQVTWSGASDPSGVAGYSITWSADPTTVPDETIDSGGTSTTSPALPDGEWWFHLRTRDGAGNWSAPVHLGPFFVDGTPPQTRILRLRVRGRRARLTFAASEPADFACALDRGRFASCRSPRLYRRLRRGRHVFRVRARDRAGNVDATPARRAWKVK